MKNLLYRLYKKRIWKDLIKQVNNLNVEDRIEIENWILSNVIRVPLVSDILYRTDNEIRLGGQKVTPQVLQQLRSESKVLQKMLIWSVINATLEEKAKEIMVKNAKTVEDIRGGKMIYYALDTQRNILGAVDNPTVDEKMVKIVQSTRKIQKVL